MHPSLGELLREPNSEEVVRKHDDSMSPSAIYWRREAVRLANEHVDLPAVAFDHKACILCDHVIVQQVLGNKCKLSGALCCYMRSCPEEDRKKREAARPVLPDKTCDPSCPDRSPVCERMCPQYQFKERFCAWLAVNYPSLDIASHQDIVDNASGLFDEFWADRS
jgi:hypothetical protein